MALAPKLLLVFVPSNSNIALSILYWSKTSIPVITGLIFSLTFITAFKTPLPPNLFLSPSRISSASLSPVEAPEGTAALPIVPDSKITSTSTVGLPLESNISLAIMFFIFILLPPILHKYYITIVTTNTINKSNM